MQYYDKRNISYNDDCSSSSSVVSMGNINYENNNSDTTNANDWKYLTTIGPFSSDVKPAIDEVIVVKCNTRSMNESHLIDFHPSIIEFTESNYTEASYIHVMKRPSISDKIPLFDCRVLSSNDSYLSASRKNENIKRSITLTLPPPNVGRNFISPFSSSPPLEDTDNNVKDIFDNIKVANSCLTSSLLVMAILAGIGIWAYFVYFSSYPASKRHEKSLSGEGRTPVRQNHRQQNQLKKNVKGNRRKGRSSKSHRKKGYNINNHHQQLSQEFLGKKSSVVNSSSSALKRKGNCLRNKYFDGKCDNNNDHINYNKSENGISQIYVKLNITEVLPLSSSSLPKVVTEGKVNDTAGSGINVSDSALAVPDLDSEYVAAETSGSTEDHNSLKLERVEKSKYGDNSLLRSENHNNSVDGVSPSHFSIPSIDITKVGSIDTNVASISVEQKKKDDNDRDKNDNNGRCETVSSYNITQTEQPALAIATNKTKILQDPIGASDINNSYLAKTSLQSRCTETLLSHRGRRKKKQKVSMLTLVVEEMMCGGCANAVKSALEEKVDGINADSVHVDLISSTVSISFSSNDDNIFKRERIDMFAIVSCLQNIGMKSCFILPPSVPPSVPSSLPTTEKFKQEDAVQARETSSNVSCSSSSSSLAIVTDYNNSGGVNETNCRTSNNAITQALLLLPLQAADEEGKNENEIFEKRSSSIIGNKHRETSLSLMDELRIGSKPLRRYRCLCNCLECICSTKPIHLDDEGRDVSLTDLCDRLEGTLLLPNINNNNIVPGLLSVPAAPGRGSLEAEIRYGGGSTQLREKLAMMPVPCGCSSK